jgi:hypothetical protein
MPRRDQVFPSQFVKSSDLKSGSAIVTIKQARIEPVRAQDGVKDMLVLSFLETRKKLIVNVTNFDTIAAIVGDDETNTWPGTRIELFRSKTEMGNQSVDCVRVRAPTKPPKASPDEIDDSIPF